MTPTKSSGQIPSQALRRIQALLSQWNLSAAFFEQLIEHSASGLFARGDCLYQRNATGDVGYLILSGLVKVLCPLDGARRVIVRIAGPGDFIGTADSLQDGGRRVQVFQAQAMTAVSAAIFTRGRVLALLKSSNAAELVALIERLNTAWSELFAECSRFLGLGFRERLQSVLEQMAARFGVSHPRGILLTPEVSQDELAEMIACSRPLVTRLIAEFIENGQLVREGRKYVLVFPRRSGSAADGDTPSARRGGGPDRAADRANRDDGIDCPRQASSSIQPPKGRRPSISLTAWERFVADRRIQQRYKITPAELALLSQVAMMGNAQASDDFLLMLKMIRRSQGR